MTSVQTSGRHSLTPAAESVAAPTFPRLLRVELRRLLARRFFLVLAGLGLVGYAAAVLFVLSGYSQVTPEVVERATVAREQSVQQQLGWYQECLADPEMSDADCYQPPTADQMPLEYFYDVSTLRPGDLTDAAFGVAAAVAMLGFVLGATFIGAEWSSKNLVAWLFWEPRRIRLLGAKALVLVGVTLALSTLAQVLWYFTGKFLLAHRGIPVSDMDPPDPEFWSHLAGVQFRGALLAVPVALLGFGLANLLRNTAAAFGVALVYLIGVEPVLYSQSIAVRPFQLTTGVMAWLTTNGTTVPGEAVWMLEYQSFVNQDVPVSNIQGGLVLLAYAAVVTAVSVWLFRRRDIA